MFNRASRDETLYGDGKMEKETWRGVWIGLLAAAAVAILVWGGFCVRSSSTETVAVRWGGGAYCAIRTTGPDGVQLRPVVSQDEWHSLPLVYGKPEGELRSDAFRCPNLVRVVY